MATLLKTDFTMTEVQPKNGKDFTLEELQGYVGGFIEIIHSDVDDSIMVVNEEGKLCGLPENVNATLVAIMKARIKKTGEIVEVICFGGSPLNRSDVLDYVNYIDSRGVEHTEPNHLNYYWDFELINPATNDHWQDVRERAAIAAMQSMIRKLIYEQ